VGWDWVHLACRPLRHLFYQPQMMDDEHGTISGMISWGKPKYPQCYFVHHKSDMTWSNSLLPLSLGCMMSVSMSWCAIAVPLLHMLPRLQRNPLSCWSVSLKSRFLDSFGYPHMNICNCLHQNLASALTLASFWQQFLSIQLTCTAIHT
jgi:hypothetical protein